jgi:hypothetical protein
LRVGSFAQVELELNFLAQMPATTFGEERVFGEQVHTRLISCTVLSRVFDAHIARRYTAYGTFFVVQHFSTGKAGKRSTPKASACEASQRHTIPRLMM